MHQQMPVTGWKYWKVEIPQEYKDWLQSLEFDLDLVDVAYELKIGAALIVTPLSPNYTGDLAKYPEVAKKLGL